MIKKYEFWNPRVFELPYYLYLGWLCLINRVSIKSLARANYALNHGEIGIGSKLHTQMAFPQRFFLPTVLVADEQDAEQKKATIFEFVEEHGYPVILKSDIGCVGKGVVKLSSAEDVEEKAPLLLGNYMLQKFTPYPYECGIFYTRYQGKPRITGINIKHFPTVVGNGRDSLLVLAKNHLRYTHHWSSFLQYLDTDQVPEKGEEVRLSFIGSHTLGCKFTDDSELLTPELEQAVFDVFAEQPGFNFGRVDVKAEDEAALQRGEFVVIEVNGVASMPTHMFDPKYSVIDAYKILLRHGRYLVQIARENKNKEMSLLSYRDIIDQVKTNQGILNKVHSRLMGQ